MNIENKKSSVLKHLLGIIAIIAIFWDAWTASQQGLPLRERIIVYVAVFGCIGVTLDIKAFGFIAIVTLSTMTYYGLSESLDQVHTTTVPKAIPIGRAKLLEGSLYHVPSQNVSYRMEGK